MRVRCQHTIIAVAKHLYERLNGGEERAREVLRCFEDAEALEKRLGVERLRKLMVAATLEGNEIAALLLMPPDL